MSKSVDITEYFEQEQSKAHINHNRYNHFNANKKNTFKLHSRLGLLSEFITQSSNIDHTIKLSTLGSIDQIEEKQLIKTKNNQRNSPQYMTLNQAPRSVDHVQRIYTKQQRSKKRSLLSHSLEKPAAAHKIQNMVLNQGLSSTDEKNFYQDNPSNTNKNSFNQIVFNYKPNITNTLTPQEVIQQKGRVNLIKPQKQVADKGLHQKIKTLISEKQQQFASIQKIQINESVKMQDLQKLQIRMTDFIQKFKLKERNYIRFICRLQNDVEYLQAELKKKDTQ